LHAADPCLEKKLRSGPKVDEAVYGYAEAVKGQPSDNA
jgi:hypothetical protein